MSVTLKACPALVVQSWSFPSKATCDSSHSAPSPGHDGTKRVLKSAHQKNKTCIDYHRLLINTNPPLRKGFVYNPKGMVFFINGIHRLHALHDLLRHDLKASDLPISDHPFVRERRPFCPVLLVSRQTLRDAPLSAPAVCERKKKAPRARCSGQQSSCPPRCPGASRRKCVCSLAHRWPPDVNPSRVGNSWGVDVKRWGARPDPLAPGVWMVWMSRFDHAGGITGLISLSIFAVVDAGDQPKADMSSNGMDGSKVYLGIYTWVIYVYNLQITINYPKTKQLALISAVHAEIH